MNPLSTSELIAALSLLLALIVFLASIAKDRKGDSARDQLVLDKLNQSMELAKETRDTVREMNRSLNDHGQTLARHEEQITTLFQRVGAVEHRCELHFGDGNDKT